jgi:hypothetical protein
VTDETDMTEEQRDSTEKEARHEASPKKRVRFFSTFGKNAGRLHQK